MEFFHFAASRTPASPRSYSVKTITSEAPATSFHSTSSDTAYIPTKASDLLDFVSCIPTYTQKTIEPAVFLLTNPANRHEPPGCEEVMTALDECHARGFLFKVVGGCNEAKRELNKCLRAERLERTRENREKSKEQSKRTRERWEEIDRNS